MIEPEIGIAISINMTGKQSSRSLKLIALRLVIIKAPTKIKAAEVAAGGMIAANGAKNKQAKKIHADRKSVV